MTDNPHRCVIDAAGNYLTFVLLVEQSDGSTAPYAYALQPGESLIEAPLPSNILKPQWVNGVWAEAATPEEIEAATPPPTPPESSSPLEVLRADVDALMIANLQMEGIL